MFLSCIKRPWYSYMGYRSIEYCCFVVPMLLYLKIFYNLYLYAKTKSIPLGCQSYLSQSNTIQSYFKIRKEKMKEISL